MTTTVVNNDGFRDVPGFLTDLKAANQQIVQDYKMFIAQGDQMRLQDPRNSGYHFVHIVTECADGRNSLLLFLSPERLLERFDIEWLPFAGTIIFPEVTFTDGLNDVPNKLKADDELRKKLFARLDFLFGRKVEQAVNEYRNGKLSLLLIEFQSHFDSHDDHHGCGAHGSNLLAAQKETIKNCQITEAWLDDRYHAEFQKGIMRVFRTVHDTCEKGPVYKANHIDNTKLPEAELMKAPDLFTFAAMNFESPLLEDEEKEIVRNFRGNPTGIVLDEHDEQIIRVSNLHFASTLSGKGVLETSWTDAPDTLFSHLKILLGIIEKNWRKRHPDKPAIIHFDLIKGNQKMEEVYKVVRGLLAADAEISARENAGTLLIVTTVTDPESYQIQEAH